jgi:hypothetical protein
MGIFFGTIASNQGRPLTAATMPHYAIVSQQTAVGAAQCRPRRQIHPQQPGEDWADALFQRQMDEEMAPISTASCNKLVIENI